MATQIAATPVIKSPEATKILKEANRKPSKESEKGVKKLADIFNRMMKQYRLDYQEIIAGASANGGCFFLC